jgi:uncharacterized membrane-anchored protein
MFRNGFGSGMDGSPPKYAAARIPIQTTAATMAAGNPLRAFRSPRRFDEAGTTAAFQGVIFMAGACWNRCFFLVLILLFAVAASAQEATSPSETAAQSAWAKAAKAMQPGPQNITLRNQATLKLPEGYGFIPTREASVLMEAMGNSSDDAFIGLIMPTTEGSDWMISVDYTPAGYIEDSDAKSWNANELLSNLKEGTEAGNKRRVQMGIPELEVTRWVESPSYDSTTQRLVWSAEARTKGAAPGDDSTVNYNTYVLGREGYVSLNLITTASTVESQKPMAKMLLGNVAFIDGKRYADFNPSTDKLAGYGLAALIGGVAAKKLGFFALIAAFFAKFFKVIILGLIAAATALRSFFSRRKS